MTNHLNRAIALLQSATEHLTELAATPTERQPLRETIDLTVEQIHTALAELSAAIDPPTLDKIPPELLTKAERLGIPLEDIEVRVAITTHHLSQFIGILNEIEQRFGEIRRVREYLLVRLPDLPIEQLGSRLPVYTAADFEWTEPRLSPTELAQIRAKYQIDRLLSQPPRHSTDLFKQIATAERAWEQARADAQSEDLNDTDDLRDLPF
ncbi:hypothetical protein [Chamaesiphon polymorphus]|uniref:Uncharacterized protein n=1 Tax=Chamaesiphon polymorphus CCALA 037 TaxID=2107692 RepID=A0A2T1F5T6_9CYAN|nr:hypothetical protein [Chamaesiphon polymorphus]PSB40351.1 hypothetical protein C7B77_28470 [Chamaesiphon polymorphus CCALA 037]